MVQVENLIKNPGSRALQLGVSYRDRSVKMWTPGGRRTDATKDVCETCGLEVEAHQAAMECDICEKWEHVEYVRRPDRIESSLYAALMASPSKACYTVALHAVVRVAL